LRQAYATGRINQVAISEDIAPAPFPMFSRGVLPPLLDKRMRN